VSSESKRGAKAGKPRRDDLPAIGVSRLRALRLINPDMKTVRLELEGLAFELGLAHTRLRHGGSWSYFICPCGRLAQTVRLLEGRLVCRTCDGLLARCQMRDKGGPIARLVAKLDDGKLKRRRGKLTRSLRRKVIVERERRLGGYFILPQRK
jgi:hypothetical protein